MLAAGAGRGLRHVFSRRPPRLARCSRREPGFTIAAVLTLALGIGANVSVFAVVNAALLRPLPYPDADRLVLLEHRDRRTGIAKEFVAMGDFVDLRARQQSFESLAAYGTGRLTMFGDGDPFDVAILQATPDLLDLLRARPGARPCADGGRCEGRGRAGRDARLRACGRSGSAATRRSSVARSSWAPLIAAGRRHRAARLPLPGEREDRSDRADARAAPGAGGAEERMGLRGGAAETGRHARQAAGAELAVDLPADGAGVPRGQRRDRNTSRARCGT